jgi:Flp pilus assembly protein CpaB
VIQPRYCHAYLCLPSKEELIVDFAENLLSTRKGTLLIGGAAAVLAAILLIVYLNRYRSSLNSSNSTIAVLVAKHAIQKGAPGNILASTRQFQVAEISKKELKPAAITDPGTLAGLVAAHDIYPGQQLTMSDFQVAAPGELQTQLTGKQRAISVPFDAPHGMMGALSPGDHVDVYVELNLVATAGNQPAVKLLMQDVLVMRTAATGAPAGTVVLRGTGAKTAQLAWAADNGTLWLVLRPASGAKPERPGLVTLEQLIRGSRPVR